MQTEPATTPTTPTTPKAADPRSPRHHLVLTETPVGDLTLVEADDALVAVWFADHVRAPLPEQIGARVTSGTRPVLDEAARQLGEYFSGRRTDFDLPLAAAGTPFQQRVWAALREIPYGTTRTYGQIATHLGTPGSSRAVGAANGRNPLSIVVPCHRVVGADGSLTGYAGGTTNKRVLLAFEASQTLVADGNDSPGPGQAPLF